MISLDGTPVAMPAPADVFGPVHFSNLKQFAFSPAHFRASLAQAFEPSREMRIGTIVHELVLGPHRTKTLVRYSGEERKGNAWKDFKARAEAEHGKRVEIVTDKEWEAAQPIAAAVLADPVVAPFLAGKRREVPLEWESAGIRCATDGIDIVGGGLIGDLKRTSCTEPGGFARHARKQWWHAQMASYEEAAKANGIDVSEGLYLIGVEAEPPYVCTVMRLTERRIESGRRSVAKWLETFRRCRDNDHWPGYSQTVVDFDLLPWEEDGE